MSADEPSPPQQGRLFVLLQGTLGGRSLTARRAAGVISIVTIVLTVASGIAVWLVDRDSFSNIGLGLWWAIQTLTTVGYGDVVPASTAGRLIGTVVMLNGIALLTVITAAVTATLIDQVRRRGGNAESGEQPADSAVVAKLDEISSRLDAIEASLESPERDRE